MSRSLVVLILFVAIIIGAMVFLSSVDTEQVPERVEKPVMGKEQS